MNWLRWRMGRSSPYNYEKMLLLTCPRLFDLYLLRFDSGAKIDWHTDPVEKGLAHHRINFFVKKAKVGGQLMTKVVVESRNSDGLVSVGKLVFKHKTRLTYMRPDLTEHAVTEVKEGVAYVLSLGWVQRFKSK